MNQSDFCTLRHLLLIIGGKYTTLQQTKNNLKIVFDKVARKLGHTSAVSKKSYVMPIITDKYQQKPSIFYNKNPKQLLLYLLNTPK